MRSTDCPIPGDSATTELVKIDALACVDVGALKNEVLRYKNDLFQLALDRNAVERALKERPQPEGCLLHPDGADALRGHRGKSCPPRERQGPRGAFEPGELAAATGPEITPGARQAGGIRRRRAGGGKRRRIGRAAGRAAIPADPAHGRLLAKYLKKITVKVIHLNEFRPTKTKVERADIDNVVAEFRTFLETAVDGDGKGQSTILEIR